MPNTPAAQAADSKNLSIWTIAIILVIAALGGFLALVLFGVVFRDSVVSAYNWLVNNIGVIGIGMMALSFIGSLVVAGIAYLLFFFLKKKEDLWVVFREWCVNSESAHRYDIDFARVDWQQSDKLADFEKGLLVVSPYLDDSEHPGKFWTFVIDIKSRITVKEFRDGLYGDVMERNKQMLKLLEAGETLEKKLDIYEEMKNEFAQRVSGGTPQVTI